MSVCTRTHTGTGTGTGRYRANEAEDRRMKSWITGSVGGNFTSAVDEMNVHFLSERALCVQAANNFVLLK